MGRGGGKSGEKGEKGRGRGRGDGQKGGKGDKGRGKDGRKGKDTWQEGGRGYWQEADKEQRTKHAEHHAIDDPAIVSMSKPSRGDRETTKSTAPLIAQGSHVQVKKHSSMGCAYITVPEQSFRDWFVNSGLAHNIDEHTLQCKPHCDKQTKEVTTNMIFAAWGRQAEKQNPLTEKAIVDYVESRLAEFQSQGKIPDGAKKNLNASAAPFVPGGLQQAAQGLMGMQGQNLDLQQQMQMRAYEEYVRQQMVMQHQARLVQQQQALMQYAMQQQRLAAQQGGAKGAGKGGGMEAKGGGVPPPPPPPKKEAADDAAAEPKASEPAAAEAETSAAAS
mmetsp:Transcript_121229/g.277843  ORF Transcript_121229/g.277843 Transcript_121229/m.277843 type:complete len:332 (+) Transcript_121229:75-1070(+)|eukprot:CAMPEP_0204335198 /NCGR_PEP_ID=MMETSP0469-20131031/18587_1 /ASSEMBLY_ACC=CAM_ASM_000384 /TAXON_ID=2969 /ORGANISM="Oxyrrhis marina" /LENGTH=331 /DNA_ID=CAMNT_0051318823 /DNA_START=68 /DNA_END=1063 /DNA_ORIENTATION=-